MGAELNITSIAELTGLGKTLEIIDKATDGTTPTGATYHYVTLATADADEALDLGDISTVSFLVIRAIDYDLDIDLDYSSPFDVDLTVKAGEPAALIPNPAGVTQVKNNGAGETPKYEVLIAGTT